MKSQTPKVLHRICGREMLSLVVSTAQQLSLSPIVVVVPKDSQPIQDAIGNSVGYAVQEEQLGTGHALLQAQATIGDADNILVLYGDVPLIRQETLQKMIRLHDESKATITLLTSTLVNPAGLGRINRSEAGHVTSIVEEEFADDATKAIKEINSGLYCFKASWLWEHLPKLAPSPRGEVFLTDLISLAVSQERLVEAVQSEDAPETMGVNNRIQLAEAETVLRQRIREHWMLNGVTMPDPQSVYIDHTVKLGQDTVILPNTHITGNSQIGSNSEIGPNSMVSNSVIGDECTVLTSVIRDSKLDNGVEIGPFSHIRDGSHLETGVHIGTSAEIKNSHFGPDTKMGHFSYMGDAKLGTNVNIGAGSITCNFDGEDKNETIIGDNAFIGCDTMLIAPIEIGKGAYTGSGAVVTKDVPPDTLVAGVPARPMPARKPEQDEQT